MIHYRVSDAVCVLQLDSPPLNTISLAVLDELVASIGRADSDAVVRAIVLTGGTDHFSAGADLGMFRGIALVEDAAEISRRFQDAFQVVEDCGKPVVAAVAGRVMGGALELAMACHFRVCTAESTFSFPEVSLGLNPGAGATQRLPRLIGVQAALKMLMTAETVDAECALELGLVDAICPSDDLIEAARRLVSAAHGPALAPAPRRTAKHVEKIENAAANRAAYDEAQQRLQKTRPEIIAPQEILEAVRCGVEESCQAGLRKEREAFARCLNTPAAQNKIYLFFATRQTAKVPQLADVRPVEIGKAAVVGMGTMGTGIVHALIVAGVPVVACDQSEAALAKGLDRIRSSLQKRIAQGKLSPELSKRMLELVSTTTDRGRLAGAELVIESVFEDVGVKRSVIGEIEAVCGPEPIIASNTSTISLEQLAEGMQHIERLCGMHFFNPAHRMPLVEIIQAPETSPGVLATGLQFAKRLRKTPVLVNNREGFLVNRIFIPYLKEAFWLLQDGAEPVAIDAAAVEFGFPMGPLALIDMAGLDILVHTDRVLSRAFPRHGHVSPIAVRLVEQGHLGQKTGSGVYKYERGDYAPLQSDVAGQIIADVQRVAGRSPGPLDRDEITQRLVLRMVSEAFYVMEEGVVGRESDLDAAMALGTGFPGFRGGLLRYARQLGLDTVRDRLEELAARLGQRFAPCDRLREMKGT
ncbi:MAG: enoyl-CoA hydratase/isomerase family protein [Pirellulales bacterium]|nr:enoyl-CoA hydratase/isomerase family protein [Pirellulales bacterium]